MHRQLICPHIAIGVEDEGDGELTYIALLTPHKQMSIITYENIRTYK